MPFLRKVDGEGGDKMGVEAFILMATVDWMASIKDYPDMGIKRTVGGRNLERLRPEAHDRAELPQRLPQFTPHSPGAHRAYILEYYSVYIRESFLMDPGGMRNGRDAVHPL